VRLEDEANVERLREKALVLARENERLSTKVVQLLKENLALKGMSPEQLQQTLALLDDELKRVKGQQPAPAASTEKRLYGEKKAEEKQPKTGHGPRAQPNLPVVPEVHDIDEADRACAECGGQLAWWEGQDDETEEVDVVERHFVMKKHVRRKYRCRCGCVEMAEMPARLVPGGRYSNDFAIEVAVQKYLDALPLERQARIMGREGLVIDSQTLWDQIEALAEALTPGYERLKQDALRAAVLGFDETPWPVLSKGSRKSWTMWQLSTRRVVFYEIAPSKGSADGQKVLEGFTGTAIGDAAVVHKALARDVGFTLAYCWTHARRGFIKAEASDPVRARQFLELAGALWTIEAQAPPGPEGDEARRKLRHEKSRPIVDDIKKWLTGQRFLPQSDIGTAIKYVAGHWDGLNVFLENPAVPLDNNQTERGYRGPAIGRNNFYGSKSRRGTEVAAIFYSLIETAKLNAVDPKAYLKRALDAALAHAVIPLPHELASAN
jgi:transposase